MSRKIISPAALTLTPKYQTLMVKLRVIREKEPCKKKKKEEE
jgi:hypothetical protein